MFSDRNNGSRESALIDSSSVEIPLEMYQDLSQFAIKLLEDHDLTDSLLKECLSVPDLRYISSKECLDALSEKLIQGGLKHKFFTVQELASCPSYFFANYDALISIAHRQPTPFISLRKSLTLNRYAQKFLLPSSQLRNAILEAEDEIFNKFRTMSAEIFEVFQYGNICYLLREEMVSIRDIL